MKKNTKIFIVAVTFLYFLEGLWMVYMGDIHTDESWWLYGSTLTAAGSFPHFDFISHHNSLFYFIYSIPQYLFGNSIIIGRLTSLFFALLTFILTMRLANKEGGRIALYIAASLFLINLFTIHRYTQIHYQVLQTFLLISLASVLFSSLNKYKGAVYSILLSFCIMWVRYPIDYFSLFFTVSMVYSIFANRKDKKYVLLVLSVASVGFIIVYGQYLTLIFEKFYFNTIWYIFFMDNFKEVFGLSDYTLMDSIAMRAHWIKTTVNNFFPILVLMISTILIKLSRLNKIKNKREYYKLLAKNKYFILFFFIFITNLFYIIPHSSDLPAQTNFIFPLMVVFASVGFVRVLNKNYSNRNIGFIVSLIFLGSLLQLPVGEQNIFSYTFNRSDIKNILDVSDEINEHVPQNGDIITFTPLFVAESNRKVVKGLEMELASFFPTYSKDRAQKYNLINIEMIIDNIMGKISSAIVLTQNRFFENTGYSIILNPYRELILSNIEKNYYLAKKVESPQSIYRGDVYIYLPRKHD